MEPIDYNSPLGVSKREWAKVLGANLALLILVYAIALICTLCGSDLFLLRFESADLQRIEETLRGWGVYPILGILFSCLETFTITTFVYGKLPKWYFMLGFIGIRIIINVVFTSLGIIMPSFLPTLIDFIFTLSFAIYECFKEKWWKVMVRLAISVALSFLLNGLISLFRMKATELFEHNYSNSMFLALTIEYNLSLILVFAFITIIMVEKKGETLCKTNLGVGGSSQNTTNSLPKNSKIAKNNLPPKYRKRLRWLKVKVIAIQTIALIVIAALPWFSGRATEFALVYASFCMTRLMLGFNRSLHFKSELSCVTIGALCFWALTFLTPSVEVLIILSLCYGAGLALGFRLWWELHDLMMYHKAAKTDRYAMLYVVFKGNCDPKHINGVMRAKGYTDSDEIKIVQLYMAKEKVEYIAHYMTFAKITIEKKLTEIATNLYLNR